MEPEDEGEKDFGDILDDQLLATEDTYVNFSGGEYGVGLTNGYNEIGPNGGLYVADGELESLKSVRDVEDSDTDASTDG